MPSSREPKNRSFKNLLASLLVDVEVPEGTPVFVIRSPIAGTPRAKEIRNNLTMYGVEMTEGVGISTDRALVEKITAEFPDYTYEEIS